MLSKQSFVKLFTLFCLFITSIFVYSQDDNVKINLISASVLEFNKSINPDYQILSGNVVFEYDGSLLYCNKALIYIKKDFVVAQGDVHVIINDTTHLYGDTLTIDGETEIAVMKGNVKLIDNDITLTTDILFYNLKTDVAYYLTGGEINDPSNYLRSERGFYYQQRKEFFFSDSVYLKGDDYEMFSDSLMYNTKTETTYFFGETKILQDNNTMFAKYGHYDTKNSTGRFSKDVKILSESRILTSDSLFYDRNTGYVETFQNMSFVDTKDNMMLDGHFARFYESDSTFFVTDSALLRMVDKGDTLYLHADSIYMINDTLIHMQKILFAHNMARMWRHDFQTVSDSVVFFTGDSLMYFYENPIMWLGNTQLVADTIQMTYSDGQMDKLYLLNNSFIISKEGENDFQQIKSSNMEGFFVDNELKELHAKDEAETLYYIFDDKMLLIGINKTHSEKVKIVFDSSAVNHIVFYNTPEGKMSPEEMMSENETKLDNFRWEQSVRPKYPTDVFRNPLIEPEARELPQDTLVIVENDSISPQLDSLSSLYPDSLMLVENGAKEREGERTEINENNIDNQQKRDSGKDRNRVLPEEETKKMCFLKRWWRNWKEKRRERKERKNTSHNSSTTQRTFSIFLTLSSCPQAKVIQIQHSFL
jgi:lipopolysaccharide export system protein LptA